MSVSILLIVLTISPLQWNGDVWIALSPETKVSYVSGFMGGLSASAKITKDPRLEMRTIPPQYVVSLLDVFYLSERNRPITIPNAITLLGRRN